jgi:hypothetical protein
MSTSYWLYMHPELTGEPGYWKVGKSLTPYSAVRSRQRFLVNDFYLTAVWFGHPNDIADQERDILVRFRPPHTQRLGSSRSELIYYQPPAGQPQLAQVLDQMILSSQRRIQRMHPDDARGYHATNSGQCCFGSDREAYAHEWSAMKLMDMFNVQSPRMRSQQDYQALVNHFGARYRSSQPETDAGVQETGM